MNNHWNKTRLIFIFWGLFLIVDMLKKVNPIMDSPGYLFFYYLPSFLLWILLTFPLLRFFDWTTRFTLWKRGLLFILVGLLVGSIKVILSSIIHFFGTKGVATPFSNILSYLSKINLFYFMEAFIISWVVIAVLFMIDLYQKYKEQMVVAAQLEKQLMQAQLQTLKMQLRPHFLFNANNAISMLVRKKENEKAIEMIAGLSDLLRTSLERDGHQLIALKEELDLLKKYLAIELIRFEDILTVQYAIEEGVKNAAIPNFLLQPLVENAFKHGISKTIGKAELGIKAYCKNDRLVLSIFNTGPNIDDQDLPFPGIGLSNTKQRLNQLYPNQYDLVLQNEENGVRVLLSIPFQLKL